VRRQSLNLGFRGALPNHAPDNFLGDAPTPNGAGFVHTSEQVPTVDVRGRGPDVDRLFDPRGNRNGSYVTTLADQDVTLDGRPIKEFATELANRWDVGYKDNNRGVLTLLSEHDRQYRTAGFRS